MLLSAEKVVDSSPPDLATPSPPPDPDASSCPNTRMRPLPKANIPTRTRCPIPACPTPQKRRKLLSQHPHAAHPQKKHPDASSCPTTLARSMTQTRRCSQRAPSAGWDLPARQAA
eukprot:363936-Chlamydomonas_euryale.AAC.3